MVFAILLLFSLLIGMVVATIAVFQPQLSRAITIHRFRRQLTKLELVTSFWRACLGE